MLGEEKIWSNPSKIFQVSSKRSSSASRSSGETNSPNQLKQHQRQSLATPTVGMGSDDSSSAGPEQDRGSGSVTNFATGAFQRMSHTPGYESDEEEDESPYRSTSSGSLVRPFIVKSNHRFGIFCQTAQCASSRINKRTARV